MGKNAGNTEDAVVAEDATVGGFTVPEVRVSESEYFSGASRAPEGRTNYMQSMILHFGQAQVKKFFCAIGTFFGPLRQLAQKNDMAKMVKKLTLLPPSGETVSSPQRMDSAPAVLVKGSPTWVVGGGKFKLIQFSTTDLI
uniref:Uncharacterized protein n=1 Tax=Romanomermis culicivorax TaxID=13658 RepID=A0A915KY56_ROMCU